MSTATTAPLNFSTQCLQLWRETGFDRKSQISALVQSLAAELTRAPKFILPDGGRPIDDAHSIARLLHMLKLPFGCVALEYRASGAIAEHESASSKRIALAWDHCPPHVAAPRFERSLFIQSIAYADEVSFWSPIPGVVEIDLEAVPGNIASADLDDEVYFQLTSHRHQGKSAPTYASWTHLTVDEYIDAMGSVDLATSHITADTSDEVLSVLSFAALTICGNVHRTAIPSSEALNAKRAKSGKIPFFDCNVLTVSQAGYVAKDPAAKGEGTGGHASPRMHLRRGHLRRLEGSVIWVNAAVVNPTQGMADAQANYEIRPERPRG